MRAQDEVRGSRSPEGADGGPSALRLVPMSCFLSLLDHASLDSYRLGSFVPVVRYGRVLRGVKEVVADSSRNPEEIASHSLRIARAVADAVGRDISERVIKRKGRRRFDT